VILFRLGQILRLFGLGRLKVRRRHPFKAILRSTVRSGRFPQMYVSLAYKKAMDGRERISRFAHETVRIPAYEEKARSGERSPLRFEWRGRWYRVMDVAATWRDHRRPDRDHPERGRAYYNVVTDTEGFFQLYYDHPVRSKDSGRWMIYRTYNVRPGR